MQPSELPHNRDLGFYPEEIPTGESARKKTEPSGLRVLDPHTLEGKPIPPREWMVEGYIPRRAVTMLGGDGGLGKSLLAMQLITAAAVGQDWLGLSTRKCKSIALFCEDPDDELQRRQDDINRNLGVRFSDLKGIVRWLPRLGEANVLMGPSGRDGQAGRWNPLYDRVMREAKSFGAGIVLLDSLHDLFAGNENIRAEARAFMHGLQRIANEINGAVILLAHPSAAGLQTGSGTSGSTAWNNAVRSRLYLRASDDDEDERTLSRKKANYGARSGDIRVKWQDGIFVRTDVEPAGGIFAGIQKRTAERAFHEAFDELQRRGQNVSAIKTARNYAPRIMLSVPQSRGFKERELETALNALLAAREYHPVTEGPPTRRVTSLVRKQSPADAEGGLPT